MVTIPKKFHTSKSATKNAAPKVVIERSPLGTMPGNPQLKQQGHHHESFHGRTYYRFFNNISNILKIPPIPLENHTGYHDSTGIKRIKGNILGSE